MASPAPAPAKPAADKRPSTRYDGLRAVDFDTRLGPGPARLYHVLDDYAGAAGTCFPHQATLAKRIGVSDRTIRRWLSELVRTGHVIPRRTGRGSYYTLAWVGLAGDRTQVSVPRSDRCLRPDRTSVAGAYKEEPYQRTEAPNRHRRHL
jgi:DNA-binding transcriptional ArsR family regulator